MAAGSSPEAVGGVGGAAPTDVVAATADDLPDLVKA